MVQTQPLENPYDAWFEAASKGDVKGLKNALRSGININALESEGYERRTALHMASRAGHLEAVKFLVRKGAKVDIRDQSRLGSSTPLHAAASQAHYQVMSYLLHRKAYPSARGERGARPLHLVLMNAHEVTEEHFHCIMLLLDHGADVNSVAFLMGGTVANQVSHLQSNRMAAKLAAVLRSRGSGRPGFNTGVSLVPSYAAGYADPEVAQHRIDRDVAALALAVYRDRTEEVRTLLINHEMVTLCGNHHLLHWAVNAGSVRMVEELLHRFSVDTKDESGNTPLLQVCQTKIKKSSDYEIAALVLKKRADTAARNSLDFTPLHLVGMDGDTGMMDLLLEAGCDLDARDSQGSTALIWCAGKIDSACMNSFHQHGSGTNPRLEAFKQLVAAGSDLNAQNGRGHTALHLLTLCQAIYPPMAAGTLAALTLLLENGGDPRLPDADGLTPLEIMRIRHERDPVRFEAMKQLLLKYAGGADAFETDRLRALDAKREALKAWTAEGLVARTKEHADVLLSDSMPDEG